MRPVNCYNFVYKRIAKSILFRLSDFLPSYISAEQTGFISSRSIFNNAVLAMDLIHDLGRDVRGENLLMKVDISKVYDKLEWLL